MFIPLGFSAHGVEHLVKMILGLGRDSTLLVFVNDKGLDSRHHRIDVPTGKAIADSSRRTSVLCRAEQIDPFLALFAEMHQIVELWTGLVAAFYDADDGRYDGYRHQQQISQTVEHQFHLQYGYIAYQHPATALKGLPLYLSSLFFQAVDYNYSMHLLVPALAI